MATMATIDIFDDVKSNWHFLFSSLTKHDKNDWDDPSPRDHPPSPPHQLFKIIDYRVSVTRQTISFRN
jgi:hypothetical protein